MRVLCARGRRSETVLPWLSLIVIAVLIPGCGGSSIAVDLKTIAGISAPANTLRVNQTLQLSSKFLASGQAMIFSVNGIPGGNATIGTISSSGLYTAPAIVPNPYTVQITSTIAKYPDATPGSVSVQIWNPIPVLSGANPASFSEGVTTVTVNGSQFVYGAQISWNGAMVPTTFVSPHRTRRADRCPQSRCLSAYRHQSRSRIGYCASHIAQGRSRPGRAEA